MPASAPGATPNPGHVPALLAQAGYVQSGTSWVRSGHPLNLVIAAPAGRQPYVAIADQLREQLVGAGIAATVETPPAGQLYEQLLSGGAATPTTSADNTATKPVDILVGPQPAGGDPATALASWFGCGTASATPGTQPTLAGPLGWCDQSLQSTITSALTGETPLPDALAKVEHTLWAQAVEIPLFQLADELAVGPQVAGVSAGPPFAGPFFDAAGWSRVAAK
jgi:ABC-type transport system substrate-binding protein